jgi:hypothetical protein
MISITKTVYMLGEDSNKKFSDNITQTNRPFERSLASLTATRWYVKSRSDQRNNYEDIIFSAEPKVSWCGNIIIEKLNNLNYDLRIIDDPSVRWRRHDS